MVILRADTGTDSVIPLPNVTGKILGKVIEYCKYHVEAEKKTGTGADEKASKTEDEVKTFDGDFVKVDQGTLFELILVRFTPRDQQHRRSSCQTTIPRASDVRLRSDRALDPADWDSTSADLSRVCS